MALSTAGTVALGGLVTSGARRNSGEGKLLSNGGSGCPPRRAGGMRVSFIGVHHAKPHCGKSHTLKRPQYEEAGLKMLAISPSSLTSPVSSIPQNTHHSVSQQRLSINAMGTVTAAQVTHPTAHSPHGRQPRQHHEQRVAGLWTLGHQLTNWQERTKE